ncbi:MAG: system, fructose-specific, subunnit [Caloramator sp.]|jgi:fructose-specific PTS system IIB-like component|uniref:PTS system IIB component, Fru family n=1 Tax=Caloramator proteoclasticus DSM 10124 TaxID=1121262 RepID=A0A1M4T3D2_9CLOT|nr:MULTISPECIES: PTS fructose transporter subunit IIB [Caloramator]MBZ4662732.1 system, fructose-specific, subunnit [Caloramator sp.]SHE38976.1 PTS system IIB component, Fru family [Caloramator proteoclasticus DSM 10124]
MKIVAVTACPTGIAHTYMAAEALERAAKSLGYSIKVETQGSIGIENKISQKEANEADLVIFAADVAVKEENRFKDKAIFRVEAQKVIKNAKAVIEEAVNQLKNK